MMSTLEIGLIAVSLAMDCFTVSVTSGIILRQFKWKTFLTMAFFFGLFQALMPLPGWYGARRFSHLIEAYDHWIAFGILTFLGLRMIKEYFKKDERCCFDPTRLKVILALSVATSIDAMAVGISFAFTGIRSASDLLCPLTVIGLVSFVMSLSGGLAGIFFGRRWNLRIEWVGGLVLIGIGVKIVIEHLFFNP